MDHAQSQSPQFQGSKYNFSRKFVSLLAAIVIQVLVISLTIIVVVVVPQKESEPEFVAKKTIYLPQRELEHQAAISEFQEAASSPFDLARLTTESLLPDLAPSLPQLPTDQFNEFEVTDPLSQAESLLNDSGLLNQLQNINAGSSKFSFLGIEDEATRVVIAFDVSSSVIRNMEKSGLRLEKLKDEAIRLIDGLNANTLVGFVQFVRAYDTFEEYLVPATQANKAALKSWLERNFSNSKGTSKSKWKRDQPDGIESIFKAAFRYQPDAIFLLSDGSFQRTPAGKRGNETVSWKELRKTIVSEQKQLEQEARIHFIGFGVKEDDESSMRKMVNQNEGKIKLF